MSKPTFNMYENKDADQLRGNRATFRSASLGLFPTKIVGNELGMLDPIIRT